MKLLILVAGMALALGGERSLRPARLGADTTVTVRAESSTLEFNPPELAVKQGTRLKLRFINAGTLPHNFVLVRDEDDIDSLAAAAARVGKDFVPHALEGKLVAWTTLASPGDTVEVTFIVPPPGVYTYVCLMTGHTNSMMGTLRSLR
ncbi:MAG TPA: plastocyanin/azurin family copper-binding protein [Gemmatimonadales bacterium]|jgi:plastocyanin|nr:plastocyanin/azurin family copper-binding protein [Gemmatimonadales bacterium]